MAKTRDIERRIRSVRNTAKITHTMELIATAKSKAAQGRLKAIGGFLRAVEATAFEAFREAPGYAHPLLREGTAPKTTLLVVTANRGLCGGFNSNVIRLAGEAIRREKAAGRAVELFCVGRKGASFFQRRSIAPAAAFTEFDSPPRYGAVERLGDELLASFGPGRAARVLAVSTRYLSAGSQRPAERPLLPLPPPTEGKWEARRFWNPPVAAFLEEALPLLFHATLFQILLESITSEQIARRIAMKNASDAADEMIQALTVYKNRARQAQITQQIAEIVGGAAAIG